MLIILLIIIVLLTVAITILVVQNHKRHQNQQRTIEKLQSENQNLLTKIQVLKNSKETLKTTIYTRTKVLSILSHNVKGPLKYLYHISSYLDKNWDNMEYDDLRSSSKAIQDTSKSVFDLLENILKWSKQQSGAIRFSPEKIKIKSLIEEEIDIHKPLLVEKSLSIKNTIDGRSLLKVDANQLRIIIQNVLSNAIKFSNVHGVITFGMSKSGSSTILTIQDEGVGMSKEEIERIFNIHDHYTRPGTGNESGNGIGLLIIQDLMSFHGGQVKFVSEPDQGTTLQLIFPNIKEVERNLSF